MTINQKQPGDKGYVYFYQNKRIELYAASQLAAKEIAVAYFKPPKSKKHMVHGMVAEDASGNVIVHTAT